MIDVTEALMQLAVALLGVIVPVVVAYAGYGAKKALDALQVKKYAEALRDYDEALYMAVMDAGRAAYVKLSDESANFYEKDVKSYIYSTAWEVSQSFSEKAGVNIDLNKERVDDLIEIAVESAKKEWAKV